jgi:TonB family protein
MRTERGFGLAAALLGFFFAAAASAAETKADRKPPPLQVEMGAPIALSWVPPAYPQEAIAQKLEGRVQVRLVVDETGTVTKARVLLSSNRVFEEAAIQSARQWRFSPPISDGRNVSQCVDATLPFRRADFKRKQVPSIPPAEVVLSIVEAPHTSAVKIRGRDPDYPGSLLSRHLPGVVVVKFIVSAEGRAQAPRVLGATHADFAQPALAAVETLVFRPAMQGDLAIAAPMESAMEFTVQDVDRTRVDVLEANGVTLANDEATALDVRPHLKILADPVYPYDLLIAGTEGDAGADFVIGTEGRVESVAVREATQPAFGLALTAALDSWLFEPALRSDGNRIAVKASLRWHFSMAPDTAVAQAAGRLLERVRVNDTADMGSKGLDGPLHPRYQMQPVYPSRLLPEKPSGRAAVQFIVDRNGRCRMARIVSATREEFGWAAATAVEQWVFDPPKKGGKAVDMRVSIPFEFKPPAE